MDRKWTIAWEVKSLILYFYSLSILKCLFLTLPWLWSVQFCTPLKMILRSLEWVHRIHTSHISVQVRWKRWKSFYFVTHTPPRRSISPPLNPIYVSGVGIKKKSYVNRNSEEGTISADTLWFPAPFPRLSMRAWGKRLSEKLCEHRRS